MSCQKMKPTTSNNLMAYLKHKVKQVKERRLVWVCSCGCVVPKKGATLAGWGFLLIRVFMCIARVAGGLCRCGWTLKRHGRRSGMVCETVKPKEIRESPQVRQVNVTDLTASQRRELFKSCMNLGGFIGFTKHSEGKQTIYTFIYDNEN